MLGLEFYCVVHPGGPLVKDVAVLRGLLGGLQHGETYLTYNGSNEGDKRLRDRTVEYVAIECRNLRPLVEVEQFAG